MYVQADAKTVGRCRCINRGWRAKQESGEFMTENYKANERRSKTVVVIGSDLGVVCMKVSNSGLDSNILVWNPMTRTDRTATDESLDHWDYDVSTYAFGFLKNSDEFLILYVYKRGFQGWFRFWKLYNSKLRGWTEEGAFSLQAQKLGPKCLVHEGVIYWIGWSGPTMKFPVSVVGFDLQRRIMLEIQIPANAKSVYHQLIEFNGCIGFMSFRNTGFTRQVTVWNIKNIWSLERSWVETIQVKGLGIPYTPCHFFGKDFISVLEARNGSGSGNDAERTDVVISKVMHNMAKKGVLGPWHLARTRQRQDHYHAFG
ncbi:hypothetical protein PIB30_045763 [Stylosanthes scabra]|uniref:F-box associated domain-containing protein n=1 Tax=Stylosanthes scabra TaxID=79078 RepID=A0ABU6TIE3_9FABA|nr:hypothetical protein [Stylosanthes scabra]